MNKEIFYLPDSPKNSITEKDIAKGVIRVTVATKPYFPSRDCLVQIKSGRNNYSVRYTKRTGRSDLLHLGTKVISDLRIKSGGTLKFTKLATDTFLIEAN